MVYKPTLIATKHRIYDDSCEFDLPVNDADMEYILEQMRFERGDTVYHRSFEVVHRSYREGIPFSTSTRSIGFSISKKENGKAVLKVISTSRNHAPLLDIARVLGIDLSEHEKAHQRK